MGSRVITQIINITALRTVIEGASLHEFPPHIASQLVDLRRALDGEITALHQSYADIVAATGGK